MRTRFPPSPTGLLHVGGLRTALYSYLLAKQTKGSFLLRIEDTDRAREVPGAAENIVESLQWAGIPPDEGVMLQDGVIAESGSHGPYKQSERLELYQAYAKQLMDAGHAYPCFCTTERLEEMRKNQEALHRAPMYDRHCLHLSPQEVQTKLDAGEPHVVRMKVPHDRLIECTDDIRGPLKFQSATVDDQVLLKSDGWPTYHLAHVVDDHLMQIDLVLRGEEWLSSLPKHLLLFEYLNWPAPRYAHVPLLLNADKTKLSKRQGSVAVQEYMEKGYLPEAMLNFLALLGWNPGTTQELFSLQELIEQFSLERVQKAGAIFDLTKLDWLQGQWMRKLTADEFAARIRPLVAEHFPEAAADKEFTKKAALIQQRITFFKEAPDMMGYFYRDPTVSVKLLASAKQKVTKEQLPMILETLIRSLDAIPEKSWNEEGIKESVQAMMGEANLKLGQLLWPLRAALTGREYSPGAFEVAAMLGKEAVLKRLKGAKNIL